MGEQRNKHINSESYVVLFVGCLSQHLQVMIVVCLCHALTPKLGIWLSNGLGVFKLVVLVLIIFTGFAALSGRMHGEKPDNFSSFDGAGSACELPPFAKSTQAANYALALLQVYLRLLFSNFFSLTYL